MLRQIAPKFGRIWNGRQRPGSSFDFSKRSFTDVSVHDVPLLISHIFLVRPIRNAPGLWPLPRPGDRLQ